MSDLSSLCKDAKSGERVVMDLMASMMGKNGVKKKKFNKKKKLNINKEKY